jgi:[ribosomal protein S18]-alanine N-acetyltransferase
MTMKRVDEAKEPGGMPVLDLGRPAQELKKAILFGPPSDDEMALLATLRAASDPWKGKGEGTDDSTEALTKLRPFIQVARMEGQVIGYVTVERDGPVQGAAYMRNIVVRPDLRRKAVGKALLDHAMQVGRDMHRRTIALRVDPANAPAVSFYRATGFTTVATVVSKKSGKLRLLMSREL